MSNPVGWFEIYVEDMQRAKAFYETVLGQTLTQLPAAMPDLEMYAFAMDGNAYGASGALVKSTMRKPHREGNLVYFSCQDCATEVSRVAGAGGQMAMPKTSIGQFGFIAMAMDTEGNAIGFHSLA